MKPNLLFFAFLFAGGVHAQSPGEITFWESVRDSKNAAELRAYLQRYPNGVFAPLAESRLAALGEKPLAEPPARAAPPPSAPVATTAPSAVASSSKMPQVGDTWTYRLTYPKRFGITSPSPKTVVIRVDAASQSEIIDQVIMDGQTATSAKHTSGSYTLIEGVSIFSPYLMAFGELTPSTRLGSVTIQEPVCRQTHFCVATARVAGAETLRLPSGSFATIRIVVEESWRPGPSAVTLGQFGMAQTNGGRTLTIWYAPAIRRAIKYSSRITVGDIPPVDPHFDLELVSYQLK